MEALWNFLKGLLIGIANAIPGVSGGTIAVITGLYDRLIGALSGFLHGGEGGWKKNALFLAPIFGGLLIGLGVFSHVIVWGRETVPLQTSFIFVGLILGSLPYLAKLATAKAWHWSYLVSFVLAAGLVLGLALSQRAPETEALRQLDFQQGLWFFGAAVLGLAAMVVPGISGSFVLLLLGAYSTFITGIKELNLQVLLVFFSGALVGLVGIAQLLNWLLKHWHGVTYWGILGLVVGSVGDLVLRSLRPEVLAASEAALGLWSWPVAAAVFAAGGAAAFLLSGEKKAAHEAARPGASPGSAPGAEQ